MVYFLVALCLIAPSIILFVNPSNSYNPVTAFYMQDGIVLPRLAATAAFTGGGLIWGGVLLARDRWPRGRLPATLWIPVVAFVLVNLLAFAFAADWRASLMGEDLRYQGLAATLLYVLLFGVAYLVMTGWSHPANPMELLIPAAYAVPGLVLFRISAFAAISMTRIPSRLLLGAGRNRHLMIMGVSGAVASLASVALLASATGAYAIPAGHLTLAVASGGIGLAWLRKVLNRP